MPQSQLTPALRRNLLVKIISQKELKPSDIDSVIEMTSEKIVELLEAQSMTFYLVVGNSIAFKHVFYSPSLSGDGRVRVEDLKEKRKQLMAMELPLIQRLVDNDFEMEDEAVAKYTARFTGEKLVTDSNELAVEDKLVEITGESIIRQTGVFPVAKLGPNSVSAVIRNPFDYPNRDSFEEATELSVDEIMVAPGSLINELINRYFKGGSDGGAPMEDEGGDISGLIDVIGETYEEATEQAEGELEEESAPILMLANRIIEDAYVQGASDIHIEPQENDLIVRYRIDGVCNEKLRLPQAVAGPIVARLKVMSELDIAEKRLPQDGRIVFKKFTKRNIEIDLRVATSPMNFGEKVVMRILDKSKSALPITALGFSEENLETYRETAEISVEAALTGHLLLSTLHTNDASSTVARFSDMGIEPFMISASMLVVCAQRLMRRVCPNCRLKYTAEGRELEMIRHALGRDWGPDQIYRASNSGCPKCGNIGMKGRVGIHELMVNSDELTRAINAEADTAELKQIAMRTGMKTLHQDAMLKVSEGVSSVLEAVSTVPPDTVNIADAEVDETKPESAQGE